METNYKVIFNVEGMDKSIFRIIGGLNKAMGDELIRVYNIYSNKANSGITDILNREFERRYPDYFKNNQDKEWYELTTYNQFMADGYNCLIVDELNRECISKLLEFYVDPEEVVFKGRLKADHNVTIDFSLKEVMF